MRPDAPACQIVTDSHSCRDRGAPVSISAQVLGRILSRLTAEQVYPRLPYLFAISGAILVALLALAPMAGP